MNSIILHPRRGSTTRLAGADAAAHSDLDLGVSGVTAIDLYMTDPGSSNTFVGHRRWVLYPPTQTMGVGDIPAESNAFMSYSRRPCPRPSVTAVAWPPAGFVPASLIPQRWSLQSDADADFSNATVAVTENGTPQSVEILSDDADDYGGNAIVWDLAFRTGGRNRGQQIVYTVNINNVLIDGQPQSFSYTTTSFDPSTTMPWSRCPPRSSSFNQQRKSPRTAVRSSLKSLAA